MKDEERLVSFFFGSRVFIPSIHAKNSMKGESESKK